MTTKSNDEQEQASRMCDVTIIDAVEQMAKNGAPLSLVLDRLMTLSVTYAVHAGGTLATAKQHRLIAEKLEGGFFDHLESTKTDLLH